MINSNFVYGCLSTNITQNLNPNLFFILEKLFIEQLSSGKEVNLIEILREAEVHARENDNQANKYLYGYFNVMYGGINTL